LSAKASNGPAILRPSLVLTVDNLVTDRDLHPRVALTEVLTNEHSSPRIKLRLVCAPIADRLFS
jgi:hypothetical protein